jgi:putative heme iron utilization protein
MACLSDAVEGDRKDVIRPTDAEAVRLARTLLRMARFGALAVLSPDDGAPMASRVAVATDIDGAPLILVSALSAHTSGLSADPRCSLLLGEPGKGDPLAHPRISVACTAQRLERGSPAQQRAQWRFLSRHPKAKLYAGFGDFGWFRLEPSKASLNGGFGKAFLLTREDLLFEGSANAALANAEASAVAHMNGEHADAVAVYAQAFAGAPALDWKLTGIDAEGLDLACGDEVRRVFFDIPLKSAGEMRTALVKLAQEGRKLLASDHEPPAQ